MKMTTNSENLRQYKSKFSLILEQILTFPSSTNFLEKLRLCLQTSNKLHNDALRYR